MTIASHTIVKNGMPFIGKVLRQVAPFMDKMFIAVSQYSDDGTIEEVMKFIQDHPNKVEYIMEGETNPAKLTAVEQFQVDRTMQDWILFLSDDDYWPADQLELCLKEVDKDPEILAYSVSPYQLLDWDTYDAEFSRKSFSKFLRKTDGLHYVGKWPAEMPCEGNGQMLYHKTNPRVKRLPYRFYHLSYLKNHSFRTEDWATHWAFKKGKAIKLDGRLEI